MVTDTKLTAAPLETPGEVLKVSRGSAVEHLDEFERSRSKRAGKKSVTRSKKAVVASPSRRTLDEAETALGEADELHRKALDQINRQIAKLSAERSALNKKFKSERETLEQRVSCAKRAYEAAQQKMARC